MSDALERLKNRPRPQVAKRDARIESRDSRDQGEGKPERQAVVEANVTEGKEASEERKQIIEAEDRREKKAVESSDNFQTKQSTVRLEAKVSERLQEQCRVAGICREVLIEALFEHMEEKPKVAQSVIRVAQEKQMERQKRASLKRARAMIEKLESS